MPRTATDLAVVLGPDRPGTLAGATEAIARAGVNIDACAELEGIFHVVANDPVAARGALDAAGFQVTSEQPVLVIEAVDRPGVVASIFRRVADAGVNVRFAYLGARNRLIVGPDDVERAAAALQE